MNVPPVCPATENPPESSVQFPFSPPWWQSCLSLPDEIDKILVGKEGSILLDFERAGKGHRSFRTVIQPDAAESTGFAEQEVVDPRIPIVRTTLQTGPFRIQAESFCSTPPDAGFDRAPRLVRTGGEEVFSGWDGPKIPRIRRNFAAQCITEYPEFSHVAWGAGGQPIIYTWNTEPGGSCEIVLGFAEGEHEATGRRILDIEVEGSAARRVDPAAAFGSGRPGLLRFLARDIDGDGLIRLSVRAASDSADQNAFLSAIWIFENGSASDEAILRGEGNPSEFLDCGGIASPPRHVFLSLEYTNTSSSALPCTPQLRLRTLERVVQKTDGVLIGGRTRLEASEEIVAADRSIVCFPNALLEPGATRTIIVSINRHGYSSAPTNASEYARRRAAAVHWWQSAPLPYDHVQVPDERIQRLIDSSVRNIYQARDLQNGLPAFHVGPTCYRQLWIVDGAFLLELVTMLGRKDEARAGIEYMLGFQQEDGGFQLKRRYWKEAGIVIWAVTRHARLSQDPEWLKAQWPRLQRAAAFIRDLRSREGAGDPNAPEFELAPWGDCDGGFSNVEEGEGFPEFSNSYWLMSGLKAFADAAEWIGNPEEAGIWREEYASFRRSFDRTAMTHFRTDPHGNRYLPILMRGEIPPQKAQWPFCHAVYPGGLFEPGDPFVTGMLAMLESVEREGLTFDTGWMPGGLWTYFASFLAHAQLWNGKPADAFAALEAFADHASPVLVWREEQKPAGEGLEEVGDMPHNWASAEFIRLALHLLVLERGDELHLLEGVPPHWWVNGKEIRAREIATIFGNVSLAATVRDDVLHVEVIGRLSHCSGVVVHSKSWNGQSKRLPSSLPISLEIPKAG